jgi:hypothetical protein
MSQEFDPNPITLTSFILEVLKTCMQESEDYTYVPGDPTSSKISILEAHRLKPDEIQKRPAIITKRGSIQVSRQTIGDRMGGGKGGNIEFYVNFSGSFNIMCVSTLPEESEAIANEVIGCLLCFQTLISKDWDFLNFQTVNIGEVNAFEEYKEAYTTPVTVAYEIAKTWILRKNAPLLKRIRAVLNPEVC